MSADFTVYRDGSISLMRPVSPAAMNWIADNLPDLESWQWMGGAIAIEWRYVDAIIDGAIIDGLIVEEA